MAYCPTCSCDCKKEIKPGLTEENLQSVLERLVDIYCGYDKDTYYQERLDIGATIRLIEQYLGGERYVYDAMNKHRKEGK